MWEMLKGCDFQANLLVGAVYFVLEAVLIVGVVQYVLQRRLDGRWASSRKHLCGNLALKWLSFRGTAERVAMFGDRELWEEAARKFEQIGEDMAQLVQTFSQSLDPELMMSAANLLMKAQELEWSCAALASTGKGSVDLAVTEFIEGANEIEKMCRHIDASWAVGFDWEKEAEGFDNALKTMQASFG